jgi:hypothetical protein
MLRHARVAACCAVCLILVGCASTQLNYNTLDLASTTDHLLTAQIVENLARFIETPTAVPAEVVVNGGTTTTADTVTPQFSLPLTQAVTLGTTVAAAATATITNSTSRVTGANSMSIGGSNVATQNWAFEPITDPDQLRRLYDLYRFAVLGNASPVAQHFLLTDYPIPYKTTTDGNKTSIAPDSIAMSGPNCVLCSVPPTNNGKCANGVHRPEGACVRLNQRLLPMDGTRSSWLRWTNLSAPNSREFSRSPRPGDIFLGQRGPIRLYVAYDQAERFAEFALFVTAAATSAPSPSAAASSSAGGAKPKGAFATPSVLPLIVQ